MGIAFAVAAVVAITGGFVASVVQLALKRWRNDRLAARGEPGYKDCARIPLERVTVLGALGGLTADPACGAAIASALPVLLVLLSAIGVVRQLR